MNSSAQYRTKSYSQEVNDILEESRREYERREKAGYTRAQAFEDFLKAQQELSDIIRATPPHITIYTLHE